MYIRGKKAILTFLKDGEYVAFRCTTDCAFTINTETKQVRTIGDGRWAIPRGQRQSYSVSMTGLVELQAIYPVTFWLIENFVMQMLPVPFRMFFDDPATGLLKYITGQAIIRTATVTGVPVGFSTGAFEMEGVGVPIISDSASLCEGTIGEISYTAGGSPGEIIIHYEDINVFDGGRLEYSVDGGGRIAVFDPGTSGDFTISGLTEGDHTVTVWAVCVTGVDGESNDLSFHVDEGGDPGVGCNVPGDIALSDITSTSFRATWGAASPAPGDGYAWELINYDTLTLVDSGTTGGLTKDNTGLTAGVTYQFRVRSVCTTGSSQSSFISTFITLVATCNVPGTPSITTITDTTATATWTAPSPAPADGYEWELLQGVTVVDSGTTAFLSVNLSGLTGATDYSFRVKALCVEGVSESGFNTSFFSTNSPGNRIDYDIAILVPGASVKIYINGIEVFSTTTTDSGTLFYLAGDDLSIQLTGSTPQTYQLTLYDSTAASNVYNNTDSAPFTMPTESLIDTHDYTITATIDEI